MDKDETILLSRADILGIEHEVRDMCVTHQPVSEEWAKWLNAVEFGIRVMTEKLLDLMGDKENENF
jgi:hypothetical protein